MGRLFTHGNGKILVCLDERGQLRDFYYPYVGLENHVSGRHVHRIGVFVDNTLHWLDHPAWQTSTDCSLDVDTCMIVTVNNDLGIRLEINDVVYNEKDIFIREITVHNLRDHERNVKLFFSQQFEISETKRGDTAYFDPRCQCIIHYKGRRVFLINAEWGERNFDDYTVGLFEIEGKEGSHVDAADGVLSKNPIEHGTVDSVIGITIPIKGKEKERLHYWITVGESVREAHQLNSYVLRKTPGHLIRSTRDFWLAWSNRRNFSFYGLSKKIIRLFNNSMRIVRAHAGNNGAIIASGDSMMLQYGRDTYGYVWPRDGAVSALALDKVGSFNTGKRFFEFANSIISDEGYFMHKYRPDGSLGSSWHPWIKDGSPELPIQEDGTALIIYALWDHYRLTKDLEFIESIYTSLIERAADFLVHYTFKDTGLPYPSYDLWEEKYGISTFTTAATYGALGAAAKFANLLGKTDKEKLYLDTAEKMRNAIVTHLYRENIQMFTKLVNFKNGQPTYDDTIDMSSFYGVFKFDVLPPEHELMQKSVKTIETMLSLKTGITGVPRYQNDNYYRIGKDMPPNPWFITTLWLAQFYIREAKTEKDLDIVKECFNWIAKYALSTGVLSEQLHPYTGEQISAAPLVWAHAEFLITIIDYLEKLEQFGVCVACNPVHE